MKTCLLAGQKWRHETCLKDVSSMSSRHVFKLKKDIYDLGILYVFIKFLQRHVFAMSSYYIWLYCPCIVLYIWSDIFIQLISNLSTLVCFDKCHNTYCQSFLPFSWRAASTSTNSTGRTRCYELWIFFVCHHIKNGWGREMNGRLLFFRTTTYFVQTTTPNLLTTRDIWWSVLADLACRPDMTNTCLLWRHVANITN